MWLSEYVVIRRTKEGGKEGKGCAFAYVISY
jgi:hypothetical protein